MEIFVEAISAQDENSILMQVLSTPRLHSSLDKINCRFYSCTSARGLNVTSFFFSNKK